MAIRHYSDIQEDVNSFFKCPKKACPISEARDILARGVFCEVEVDQIWPVIVKHTFVADIRAWKAEREINLKINYFFYIKHISIISTLR